MKLLRAQVQFPPQAVAKLCQSCNFFILVCKSIDTVLRAFNLLPKCLNPDAIKLDELESKRPMLLDYKARNDKALLAALVCANPDATPKQLLILFGLRKAFETMDAKELRVMFAKCNQKSWYRLIANANKARLPNTGILLKL